MALAGISPLATFLPFSSLPTLNPAGGGGGCRGAVSSSSVSGRSETASRQSKFGGYLGLQQPNSQIQLSQIHLAVWLQLENCFCFDLFVAISLIVLCYSVLQYFIVNPRPKLRNRSSPGLKNWEDLTRGDTEGK